MFIVGLVVAQDRHQDECAAEEGSALEKVAESFCDALFSDREVSRVRTSQKGVAEPLESPPAGTVFRGASVV